jgi:dihydrofolate reductase
MQAANYQVPVNRNRSREMMSKVYLDVGVSLDRFTAGPNGGPGNPLGDGGTRIHEWVFRLATFLERLGLPGGGESGPDDEIVKAALARPGAYVMGRRMFDEGEVGWPENPPFQAPVFVLAHIGREPWIRKGGTTFHFVTDGMESALSKAKTAAGGKDVRVSGGANTIQQFMKAGLIDEMRIHHAPVLLGECVKLFEHLGAGALKLEVTGVIHSPLVTHIAYRVVH